MKIEVYSSFEALPERVMAFAEVAAHGNFFRSLAWFRTVLKTAVPARDGPRIYVAEEDGRPTAALIGSERWEAGRLRAHMMLGTGQGMYAATYGPLLDPTLGIAGLRTIAAAVTGESPAFDVLRFDGLDPSSVEFSALWVALRERGMLLQRFANFASWAEGVRGLSFENYLARRPPCIRDVAERGLAGSALSSKIDFELVTEATDLARPLIDYALVDLQSASPPEVYPDSIAEVVQVAAAHGYLRFGLLYVNNRPAAAQIWVVAGGTATNWRQRHVAQFDRLPIQASLTVAMLRHLFDADKIDQIEFSRDSSSSDVEPQHWLTNCRERVGLIAVNRRTGKGLLAGARHIGGHAAISAVRRIRSAARAAGVR
jgi:hypothetical protein